MESPGLTRGLMLGVVILAFGLAPAHAQQKTSTPRPASSSPRQSITSQSPQAASKQSPQAASKQSPPRAQKPDAKGAAAPRQEPGADYQASIRRTVERRRARKARRGASNAGARPPGAITPWLMPPALIIRHTPETHDEVAAFLDLLRRS